MGAGKRGESLRRCDDGEAGARQIKKWRNRPDRHECGPRFSLAALFGGRDSFPASPVSGHISRKQRNHTGRARARLHDISKRWLATEYTAHFGTDRRKRWNGRLGRKTRADTKSGDQTRNGLRSALLSG